MVGMPKMQEQFSAGASMAPHLSNEVDYRDARRKCRSNFRRCLDGPSWLQRSQPAQRAPEMQEHFPPGAWIVAILNPWPSFPRKRESILLFFSFIGTRSRWMTSSAVESPAFAGMTAIEGSLVQVPYSISEASSAEQVRYSISAASSAERVRYSISEA